MTLRAATKEEQSFFSYAQKSRREALKRIKKQTRNEYRIRRYMFALQVSLADESMMLFGTPIWY
jgi:hypothetical protein